MCVYVCIYICIYIYIYISLSLLRAYFFVFFILGCSHLTMVKLTGWVRPPGLRVLEISQISWWFQ